MSAGSCISFSEKLLCRSTSFCESSHNLGVYFKCGKLHLTSFSLIFIRSYIRPKCLQSSCLLPLCASACIHVPLQSVYGLRKVEEGLRRICPNPLFIPLSCSFSLLSNCESALSVEVPIMLCCQLGAWHNDTLLLVKSFSDLISNLLDIVKGTFWYLLTATAVMYVKLRRGSCW